jgi:hypothetical protein
MNENESRMVPIVSVVIIAALFLTIALAGLPWLAESLFGELNGAKDKLTLAQLIVSFFGFMGAISAFSFAIFQYKKS